MQGAPMSKILSLLIFILFFSQPANSTMATLKVEDGDDFYDGEEKQMCIDALMHGNLLKISGNSWTEYDEGTEFVSFYDGRVFNYFGHQHQLICNVNYH